MHALKPLLVLAALVQALALLLSQHSTGATLTDQATSASNAVRDEVAAGPRR